MGLETWRRWAVAVIGVLALCGAGPASAALVTYHFSGSVDFVESQLVSQFAIGQSVAGSWTVDSELGALQSVSVSFAAAPGGVYNVQGGPGPILMGFPPLTYQAIPSIVAADPVEGFPLASLVILLRDAEGAQTQVVPLDLGAFESGIGSLNFTGRSASGDPEPYLVTFTLSVSRTSVVPAPASIALVLLGMAALAAARRRA